MQPNKHQQLQVTQNGRSLAGWCTSRPHPRARAHHVDWKATATVRDPVSAVDLIQWPEGTRPKRGGVTKHSLTRLKVAELRAELQRLGAEPVGTKEQLAERLLQLITGEAAAASQTAATAGPAAIASASQTLNSAQDQLAVPAAASAADKHVAQAANAHRNGPFSSVAAHTAAEQAAVQTALGQLPLAKNNSSSSSSSSSTTSLLEQQQQQITISPQQDVQPQVEHTEESPTGHLQQQQQQQQQQRSKAQIVPAGRVVPVSDSEAARVAAAAGVDLADVPPLAEKSRGQVYDVEGMMSLTPYQQETVLKANRSGLCITLLGGAYSSAAETGEAASSCLALLREKDIWLFDVGEDVQRAVIWREHIKPSKLHRLVVTRQSPESLLGLPGILCVIGASREKGHEFADIPVQVFAPEGTAELLSTLYECSNTFLEMPVVIYEFVTRAVSDSEMRPHALNRRAKIFRAVMPPDQLNPQGWTQAAIDAFQPLQGRATVRRGIRASAGVLAVNPRAGYRPFITPQPGDPSLEGLQPCDMTWTVVVDEAAMMTAVMCEADSPTWGVVFKEADKQGNLNVARCNAFKITDGCHYSAIKNGESVPNEDGVMVPAGLLCSADKPGRKVVLLPPCSSADNLARHAADADVMFGDAAAAAAAKGVGINQVDRSQQEQEQQQRRQQHQVLGMGLGMCAQEWGVRHLVVTGMPGQPGRSSADVYGRRRTKSSSRDGNCIEGSSDSDDEAAAAATVGEEQQQHQQQLDPAVSALLGVIAEQYTAGAVMPGRDGLSLIVEENAGHLPPPPVDYAEKTATAWATALNGLIEPSSTSSAGYDGKMNQRQQATGSRTGGTADRSRSDHQQNRHNKSIGSVQDKGPKQRQPQHQWDRQGREQQQHKQEYKREDGSSDGKYGFQQQQRQPQRGRQKDGRVQEHQRDRKEGMQQGGSWHQRDRQHVKR